MTIVKLYDVTCNVCSVDLKDSAGKHVLVSRMEEVELMYWLVLYNSLGDSAYAAICPDCWRQIAACWETRDK